MEGEGDEEGGRKEDELPHGLIVEGGGGEEGSEGAEEDPAAGGFSMALVNKASSGCPALATAAVPILSETCSVAA